MLPSSNSGKFRAGCVRPPGSPGGFFAQCRQFCPTTAWLLGPYLLTVLAEWGMRLLNMRHLAAHGLRVPAEFTPYVAPDTMAKSSAYTVAQQRYGLVEDGAGTLVLVLFVFAGLLERYDRWIATLHAGFVGSGLLFFFGLLMAETLGSIPFNLYHTFVLERRFGFATTSFGLWLSDLAKGTLLSLLLGCGLLAAAISLVAWQPQQWWLWVWGFLALVTLLLIYLSPVLIEPLFNTYQPVADPELETAIRATMASAGLRVSAVLQVDASRRSRHSNAYFTGIGRVKRIVLYDTLLTQLDRAEIVAVLAHEVGHWRLGHIWKRLLVSEVAVGAAAYGAYRLLAWGGLPALAGASTLSFAAQLVVLGVVGSVLGSLLAPLSAWMSRRDERQADDFAVALCGSGADLATGLIKLSRENLANLYPHPFYAALYYSHPPVVDRVRRLLGR